MFGCYLVHAWGSWYPYQRERFDGKETHVMVHQARRCVRCGFTEDKFLRHGKMLPAEALVIDDIAKHKAGVT